VVGLTTLRKDPYWAGVTAALKLANLLGFDVKNLYSSWAKFRFQRVYSKIDEEAWGRSPIYSDLWFLYRSVRKHKPRTILEIGSGCSTIAMSQALADNGFGHLYAFEHSCYWGDATKTRMPQQLKDYCTIKNAPIRIVEYGGKPRISHPKIPQDLCPEFIYLDSPPVPWPGNNSLPLDEMDPVGNPRIIIDPLLQQNLGKFVLVVDGKKATANFLKSQMEAEYHVRYRSYRGNTIFVPK
jgi:hypothetical protein